MFFPIYEYTKKLVNKLLNQKIGSDATNSVIVLEMYRFSHLKWRFKSFDFFMVCKL